jgi:spore coat polysaccharide biosynthesis protein SpsF
MVAGPLVKEMPNHSLNIGFIIQARMRSKRLPGKVLLPMPIGTNDSMLGCIIKQLGNSSHAATIVVATALGDENDPISKWCDLNGVICFRGDEQDVLSRFISITQNHAFDVVVRLTADNPLIDLEVLDQVIDAHIKSDADYTCSSGMPLGMNIEVVRGTALLALKHRDLDENDREHVTHYFRNSSGFSVQVISITRENALSTIRTTVDYPEDYMFMSTVISYKTKDVSGLNALEKFLQAFPFLMDVNKKNLQKRQFDDPIMELQTAAQLLESAEMHRAAQTLRDSLTCGAQDKSIG